MSWQRRFGNGIAGGSGLDLLGRSVALGAAVLMAAPIVVASLLTMLAR